MLFNSFQYLLFFPAVTVFYFALPQRFRWVMLLGASYFFYMCWKPEYAVLIALSTLVDYWAALRMGRETERRERRKYLIASLVANLGLLFTFKYFNFFSSSLSSLIGQFGSAWNSPTLDILLPVGISFYTFQTLSYTIDVYRGERPPERHLGIFALYVSFFPQLVAGPIERSTRLLPQFFEKKGFEYGRAVEGLRLILWGLFKKVVIADRLALYVDRVYDHPDAFHGWPLIVATYFFAFQIYCDFSGYTDIARGSAKVLGYDLMENFRRPYFARSIADFWRRWHISLSTWFRDYLYVPLGGNRVGRWRRYYNLIVVFVLSGLWHGANWTFMIWGALHGLYMVVSRVTQNWRNRLAARSGLDQRPALRNIWQVLVTFHLTLFAWVFFRANSFGDALTILGNSLSLRLADFTRALPTGFYNDNFARGWFDLVVAFALIGLLVTVQFRQSRSGQDTVTLPKPIWLRWSVYYAAVLAIILFGVFTHAEFIYFQF